jgi:hypothetical protein
MKIVYIAGLGHSGSTILDLALGCNEKIVGLGEVFSVLKSHGSELQSHAKYNDIFCSCGQMINDCDFWGNAKKKLMECPFSSSAYDKYKAIMECFEEKFGADMILLDSSKNPNNYLMELNKVADLKIIYLVRDIRSWCYSRNSRLGSNHLRLAYQWFKGNMKILHFIKKNNFEYKVFGYEEIAIYPSIMFKKICDFIGADYDDVMLVPDKSQSHVFYGNVAKGDKNKRKGIIYDARWMTSLPLVLYSTLFFPLMLFNKKMVYSNFMRKKTFAFKRKQQDFIIFGDKEKENLVRKKHGIH